jgi:hypothetical protein
MAPRKSKRKRKSLPPHLILLGYVGAFGVIVGLIILRHSLASF